MHVICLHCLRVQVYSASAALAGAIGVLTAGSSARTAAVAGSSTAGSDLQHTNLEAQQSRANPATVPLIRCAMNMCTDTPMLCTCACGMPE